MPSSSHNRAALVAENVNNRPYTYNPGCWIKVAPSAAVLGKLRALQQQLSQ